MRAKKNCGIYLAGPGYPIQYKYLEYKYKLHWFRRIILVGSTLGFMTSPAMVNCLGLQYQA